MRFIKEFIRITILLGLLSSLLFTGTAYASWYSFYQQGNFYGIWATIHTPGGRPFVGSGDGQSHSVTTPGGGDFVQTGWLLHDYQTQALQYYEYGVNGMYDQVWLNPQAWGTGIKYEVSQEGALDNWCVWINGVQVRCWAGVNNAPMSLIAQSEIHIDPNTVISTKFEGIRVRNASGVWIYPTLNGHAWSDPPYKYAITSSDSFITFRLAIYLPLVVR